MQATTYEVALAALVGITDRAKLAAFKPHFEAAQGTALILTGFVVWFGLFPDSLIVVSQDAASGLLDPTSYIRSVFPEGGAR